MSDLLSNQQVDQIRKVFHDLSDTFAFPVIIRRTTFANGAFRDSPSTEDFSFNAIREFVSEGENDRFRNDLGPDAAHERKIYLNWDDVEAAGLTDADNKVLLDHNDLVVMEGETYEVISFGGIADMSKKPSFVYLQIKRRWADGGNP
ncbi:MAG: hypothetical protein HY696_09230 [Deltaproteobacteria bacterium]|nr:hypothetical protein [Deltaproteobacteria bacterium]